MNRPARILVTRSEPAAHDTAERLRALGFEPIVEPLFGIEALTAVLPPRLDALAFTSLNGVRAFARLDLRRELPVFCVGGRTAETATEAGFTNVSSADGDVGDLAALIKASLPKGAHVLHAGNEDAVGDLAGALEAAGLEASFVPLFRAAPMTEPGSILKRHLLGQPEIDAVLIHSARAASVLAQFLAAEPGASPVSVAAISAQACRPLEGLVNRIEIAGRPDEPSLLEALAHLLDRA